MFYYFDGGCFIAIFTTKNILQKKRQHDEQYESIGKNAINVIMLSNKPTPKPSIILANFNVSS